MADNDDDEKEDPHKRKLEYEEEKLRRLEYEQEEEKRRLEEE